MAIIYKSGILICQPSLPNGARWLKTESGSESANSDLVLALATTVGAVSTPQAGQGQALSQQSAARQVQTPATLSLPLSQPAGTSVSDESRQVALSLGIKHSI